MVDEQTCGATRCACRDRAYWHHGTCCDHGCQRDRKYVIQGDGHGSEPRCIGTGRLDDHATAGGRLERSRTGRVCVVPLGLIRTARLVDDATVGTREVRARRRGRWNQQNQREQDRHEATHEG